MNKQLLEFASMLFGILVAIFSVMFNIEMGVIVVCFATAFVGSGSCLIGVIIVIKKRH